MLSYFSTSLFAYGYFLDKVGAHHHFRADRKLMRRKAQCFFGQRAGNAADLKHDTTRLDDRYPVLGRTLTGSHSGFGRLLGDRLIGEDPDPDLTVALHRTRKRHTHRFDLTTGDPTAFERLQPKTAKCNLRAARSLATHTALLHLTIFYSLW